MSIPLHEPNPSVVADDAGVLITDLYTTDTTLIEVVCAADDPDEAVRQCLEIGARASQLVQTTVDSEIVEKHFHHMTTTFGDGIDNAVEAVGTAAAALVGEDGSITKTLTAWKADVERTLDENFDPDSKKSVMAKVETLIAGLMSAQQKTLENLVDPHATNSPLKIVKDELDSTMRREVGEVKAAVIDLAERFAVKNAHDEAMEFTTKKGFAYEDLVHDLTCQIAAPFGDSAEQVGTAKGADGTQRGDEVVTLNADDTFGAPENYVLEVKDRKLSLAETQSQLDEALTNREAKAAIAVFSSQELAPTTVPFQYAGNKAIVVVDKTDINDRDLRLACMWARWVVRRQLSETIEGVDAEHIEAKLADAALALKKLSTIKRSHTAAKKSIDMATAAADAMAADVDEAINAIRDEIGE